MWQFDEEFGVWWFDGYTDLFCYQKHIYEYPPAMHLEKLNMSITEAAIATLQRVQRDDYQETKWQKNQP